MVPDAETSAPVPGITSGLPALVIEGDPDGMVRVLEALAARGLRVARWRPAEALADSNAIGGEIPDLAGGGADVWVVAPVHALGALEAMRPMPALPKGRPETPPLAGASPSLERLEWAYIQQVLSVCGGNISAAARRLGIHRRSLQRKLGKVPPTR